MNVCMGPPITSITSLQHLHVDTDRTVRMEMQYCRIIEVIKNVTDGVVLAVCCCSEPCCLLLRQVNIDRWQVGQTDRTTAVVQITETVFTDLLLLYQYKFLFIAS